MSARPLRVSIVIPTLEEASTIVGCLESLQGQEADEVIVVDAESRDGTGALAVAAGARVVMSPRGRSRQQNLGAAATTGEILLFLHADCRLEAGAITALRQFVGRHPAVPAGCFRMHVDDRALPFRGIDAVARLRAGLFGVPYGDQGIFVSRWAFDLAGGFPEVPLMEDVFLASRLRQLGRMVVLRPTIQVSPRRWRQTGLIRQTILNWTLLALAGLGVGADRLARFYAVVR